MAALLAARLGAALRSAWYVVPSRQIANMIPGHLACKGHDRDKLVARPRDLRSTRRVPAQERGSCGRAGGRAARRFPPGRYHRRSANRRAGLIAAPRVEIASDSEAERQFLPTHRP
jgi:hypothetical protein